MSAIQSFPPPVGRGGSPLLANGLGPQTVEVQDKIYASGRGNFPASSIFFVSYGTNIVPPFGTIKDHTTLSSS